MSQDEKDYFIDQMTILSEKIKKVVPITPFNYRGTIHTSEQLKEAIRTVEYIPKTSDSMDLFSVPSDLDGNVFANLSLFSLAVVTNNKSLALEWSHLPSFSRRAFANQAALLLCPTKEVYDTLISCGIEFSPEVITLAISRTSEYELAQPLIDSISSFEKPKNIKQYEPFYPINAGLCQLWIDAGYVPTADELVFYNSSALCQALQKFDFLATEKGSQGMNLLHKVCKFYGEQDRVDDYCYVDDEEFTKILSVCLRNGCVADMKDAYGQTVWEYPGRVYRCLISTGFFNDTPMAPPTFDGWD